MTEPHWTEAQQSRLAELLELQKKDPDNYWIGYWNSDPHGFPANGGTKVQAYPGAIHEEPGPIRTECGEGQLHATANPVIWKGHRVWIVCLLGKRYGESDKRWSLKREVLGDIYPNECFEESVGARLGRKDLTRANLSRAYLIRADLSRADLSYANLSGANLSRAYLNGADLSRANLSRANLSRANLIGAYLTGADLTGADLSGANLSGADLNGADLNGADLNGAYLNGANLSGADLNGADLTGAYRGLDPAPTGWIKTSENYLERVK